MGTHTLSERSGAELQRNNVCKLCGRILLNSLWSTWIITLKSTYFQVQTFHLSLCVPAAWQVLTLFEQFKSILFIRRSSSWWEMEWDKWRFRVRLGQWLHVHTGTSLPWPLTPAAWRQVFCRFMWGREDVLSQNWRPSVNRMIFADLILATNGFGVTFIHLQLSAQAP